MRFTAIPILTILFLTTSTLGQTRIITGKIVETSFYSIPQFYITYADSMILVKTESNGIFKIEVPIAIKSLQFGGVGLEEKIINLSTDCNYLEIIMLYAGHYDFMSPRKVDRERKKYFNTLPKRRMEAYEKGIFKMATGCYEDIFIPHKEELKEIHRRLSKKYNSHA